MITFITVALGWSLKPPDASTNPPLKKTSHQVKQEQ